MFRRKPRNITFSVPIKKECDNCKTSTYLIKFIESFRFISNSLSDLVDNLSERLRNNKCSDFKFYLDYISTKDDQLIFRCFKRNNNYKKDFNKDLIKKFVGIYEFCDGDINKLIL